MNTIYVTYIAIAIVFHIPFDSPILLLPFVPPIEETTVLTTT